MKAETVQKEKIKKPRAITLKQKRLVEEYIKTGNKVQSALKVYDTDDYSTASQIAGETLEKPRVIEYMKSISQDVAEHIKKLAFNAENENVQLSASKDILDRAGYKAIDKSTHVNVNVDATAHDPRMKAINEEYNQKMLEALKDI